MRIEDYTFGLWWNGYDSGYETLLTILPLLFTLSQYSVGTFYSQLLLLAGAVGFHLSSNFATQALYHIALMWITLDILEKNRVGAGRYKWQTGKTPEDDVYIDWLDTVIGVGFACGLIHPLILYTTLAFLHCYVAQQTRNMTYLALPIVLVWDVIAPGLAIHFATHIAVVAGTVKRAIENKGEKAEV